MELDLYQVKVLHYLNPHLIWVEVIGSKKDEFIFEQIGVYGLLPFEPVLNINGNVETRRCEKWLPAAETLLKKSLGEASEVWFSTTYIDRRSSIFDNNIHKFGKLIIQKANGKKKDLTKQLLKSGLAFENIPLFHEALSSGCIKTKLDHYETEDVIKHLKRHYQSKGSSKQHWENSFVNQTSVYHVCHTVESNLTQKNLEKHNRENIQKLLEDKIKDFEKCKDINEISIGRATSKKSSACLTNLQKTETNNSSLLKRKLLTIKEKGILSNKNDEVAPAKHFLDGNPLKEFNFKSEKNELLHSAANNYSRSRKVDVINENHLVAEEIINHGKDPDLRSRKKTTKEFKVVYGPPTSFLTLKVNVLKQDILDKCDDNFKENNMGKFDDDFEEIPNDDKLGEDSLINIPITNLKFVQNNIRQEKGIETGNKDVEQDVKENFYGAENIYVNATKQSSTSPNTLNLLKHKLELNKKFKTHPILQNGKECNNEMINPSKEMGLSNMDCKVSENLDQSDVSYNDNNKANIVPVETGSSLLKKKLRQHKELRNLDSSSDTSKHSELLKKSDLDSDEEDIDDLIKKIDLKSNIKINMKVNTKNNVHPKTNKEEVKVNVNPFKNLDGSKSVFVEKLISPLLLVHTKKNNCIKPSSDIKDTPFGNNIQLILRNMSVKEPTRLQSVSWHTILRGHSTFLISPLGSGKTVGYLPAVCRLVEDCKSGVVSEGPTCIIVCATAKSVADVEKKANMFLGLRKKVLACYTGMTDLDLTTSILNGCDLLITTPCMLVRLLQTEYGVDLQRLTTLILDDCERLLDVYISEVKLIIFKINENHKTRAYKMYKVQIIVASRKWSTYLEKLAKKAPDSVVCIGAFQESVLYSKVNTTVDFIKEENKINFLLEFLKNIDSSKRTIVVCRHDDEIKEVTNFLKKFNHVIFNCNSTMTVQDLFDINIAWTDYSEPVLGPILVCCDSNLSHLNVTDAHYLVHYSLPELFSMFCRRFAVLNDNYSSIFKEDKEILKIKILLEETNVGQLPKILNFIKRCTDNVPEALDEICEQVLAEKNLLKAKDYIPLCDNLLALGECPDFLNCSERHAILCPYDKPKDWMPTEGIVTFKVLHFHTPTLFSARLLTNTFQNQTKKYVQTYSTLFLKLGMYFSKESHKRLHGLPKLGDICAVSIKQHFFERCQVMKILNYYPNGNPKYILIKLIDEERLQKIKDIYLYYLPDELKNIETHVIHVRLANIQPQDKDVTFPDIATAGFKKITETDDNSFLRGHITLTIGNCIFVDTLEACKELTSLNDTVVKYNFKNELLEKYAIPKMDHITILQNMCEAANLLTKQEIAFEEPKPVKLKYSGRWAYLESDVFSKIYFTSAESPSKFFVRLVKFNSCLNDLIKDINKYVENNPETLTNFETDDIVIAKFPDDGMYERARIEEIYDDHKVKCFFVDIGDWRVVSSQHIVGISKEYVDKIPFQAIECSLIGVEPVGSLWTEFSTNWLSDYCYDDNGLLKELYVKYFDKNIAEVTKGHKYSVALIDTCTNQDVVVNKKMTLLHFAKMNDDFKFLNELCSVKCISDSDSINDPDSDKDNKAPTLPLLNNSEYLEKNYTNNLSENNIDDQSSYEDNETSHVTIDTLFPRKPIRSVPLVTDDSDLDRWDVCMPEMIIKDSGINLSNMLAIKEETKTNSDDQHGQIPSTREINEIDSHENKFVDKEDLEITFKNEKSVNVIKSIGCVKKDFTTSNNTLDSDDLSSIISNISENAINNVSFVNKNVEESTDNIQLHNKGNKVHKPKLCWRQNKTTIFIKILLIGVENYILIIKDSSLSFTVNHNELIYSFDFELYGGVHKDTCSHSNRGQYILVKLSKILQRNWLTLTKDIGLRKWIVYDLDSIETLSDEEEINMPKIEFRQNLHVGSGTDSDDDLTDDMHF